MGRHTAWREVPLVIDDAEKVHFFRGYQAVSPSFRMKMDSQFKDENPI